MCRETVASRHGLQQYHRSCSAISSIRVIRGTAKCMSRLFRAGRSSPVVMRQSNERLPLVMDEKAKLAVLNTHRTVEGRPRLMLPMMVIYCSHRVTTCDRHMHIHTQLRYPGMATHCS